MNAQDDVGEVRNAFGAFERSLGTREMTNALREALDYYLEIIEDPNRPQRAREIAHNLAETYWIRFVEAVADIADRPGAYDFDTCMMWLEPAVTLRDAGVGDAGLNERVADGILRSAYKTLSPEERRNLKHEIRRLIEKKHVPGEQV